MSTTRPSTMTTSTPTADAVADIAMTFEPLGAQTSPATPTAASAGEPAKPRGPTFAGVMQRALLGLALMATLTGLAAFIAHASFNGTDPEIEEISIGLPAAVLIVQDQRAAPKR